MPDPGPDTTARFEPLIDRLNAGDPTAVDDLIRHSMDRIRRMARGQLRLKPHVKRWYDTDDVSQNVMVRLVRALKSVRPKSARDYFGLAAVQIRRELADLARKEGGPLGRGRHHKTEPPLGKSDPPARPRVEAVADDATGPGGQAEQAEFHELVARLPEALREVFDLRYYHGLTEDEAARFLRVSPKTLQRRWREARLAIAELGGMGGNEDYGD